ncbi:unnamed protein product [Victoria cruziana]
MTVMEAWSRYKIKFLHYAESSSMLLEATEMKLFFKKLHGMHTDKLRSGSRLTAARRSRAPHLPSDPRPDRMLHVQRKFWGRNVREITVRLALLASDLPLPVVSSHPIPCFELQEIF